MRTCSSEKLLTHQQLHNLLAEIKFKISYNQHSLGNVSDAQVITCTSHVNICMNILLPTVQNNPHALFEFSNNLRWFYNVVSFLILKSGLKCILPLYIIITKTVNQN